MLGSTGSGRDRRLNEQDGLFTLVVQGHVLGAPRRDVRVVASVSRALPVSTGWAEVLRIAEDPALELIFSNTTEVGIAFDESDAAAGIGGAPHRSFAARLTHLLAHRARHFAYDPKRAPVVIPCELVEDNGDLLRAIVHQLSERWSLGTAFRQWLDAVPFCNTLVDRIVQGAPTSEQARELDGVLGYDDAMVTVCEPYRLFAIEAPTAVRDRLRFAEGDPGVVLTDDVAPYRERKLRLLNGTHTALVSIAILAGCTTVGEALAHPLVGPLVRTVLLEEIVPTVRVPDADAFARDVLERFENPFMRHALWDITLQGGTKWRVRLVPVIEAYARSRGRAPRALALAFAAYLALQRRGARGPSRAGGSPGPTDAVGDAIHLRWAGVADEPDALFELVRAILADAGTWGTDLTAVPGLVDAVAEQLVRLRKHGAEAALASLPEVPA